MYVYNFRCLLHVYLYIYVYLSPDKSERTLREPFMSGTKAMLSLPASSTGTPTFTDFSINACICRITPQQLVHVEIWCLKFLNECGTLTLNMYAGGRRVVQSLAMVLFFNFAQPARVKKGAILLGKHVLSPCRGFLVTQNLCPYPGFGYSQPV